MLVPLGVLLLEYVANANAIIGISINILSPDLRKVVYANEVDHFSLLLSNSFTTERFFPQGDTQLMVSKTVSELRYWYSPPCTFQVVRKTRVILIHNLILRNELSAQNLSQIFCFHLDGY